MRQPGRIRRIATWLALAGSLGAGLLFVAMRVTTPSDAARVAFYSDGWSAAGIQIAPIDEPAAGLAGGDLVSFGYSFGWLTLLILVLALVGRMPRRITGLSVLLLVLFSLQSVFVGLRPTMPAVAALHQLKGFAILAIAWVTTRASWAVRRERAPVATADTGPTLTSTTERGSW